MAGKSSSAQKRHKQSEVRRLRNKSVKSSVRTSAKKFTILAKSKSVDVPASEEALKTLIKQLDSAAHKGILTRNSVSRKKSRMQRLFNSVNGTSAPKIAVVK